MQLQECLAEASGESRSRLGNSALSSCKLCSEAGQEVVLGLLRCQDGYRRKYAECICRQEDYVVRSRAVRDRLNDLLNVIDRIRYTGVLGNALVCEIDLAVLINSNVLKKSISSDCTVDVRLSFLVKVDTFA